MIIHNKDKNEIIFTYYSCQGLVQGRLVYTKPDHHQVTFNLVGRTVPYYDSDLEDIGTLLAVLGEDLKAEAKEEILDVPTTET